MTTLKEQLESHVAQYDHWATRRRYGPDGHNNRSLWVLACMDERLPVDEALGIHVDTPAGGGDAHCFRNAGGIVTDDAIRSAMLTCNFFGTKEIVIVQHTQCGMLSANAADLEAVEMVAPTQATVLITGDTGVGKEVSPALYTP